MKVEFIIDYEARTNTGTRQIAAGTVLDLEEGKARKLIAAGIAKDVEPVPFNPDALPYLDNRGRLVIPFDCPPKYRYWQGGQGLRVTLTELFEERAAIMEFEGKMTREESEQEAARIMTQYVQNYPVNIKKGE